MKIVSARGHGFFMAFRAAEFGSGVDAAASFFRNIFVFGMCFAVRFIPPAVCFPKAFFATKEVAHDPERFDFQDREDSQL